MNEYNGFDSDNERIILTDTKQKKKSRILRITAGAAAGLAAVGAVSAAASPAVRNTAKMAFSSPANYYAGVLHSEALSRSEKLAQIYDVYCTSSSEGVSENGNVTIELGKEAAEDIQMPAGTKLGFDYSLSAKDETAAGTFGISADGTDIIDFSAVTAEKMLYFSVPTVSSAWLTISSDELTDAAHDIFFGSLYRSRYDEDGGKKESSDENITVLDGTVFTRERTDRIFTKYTDIYLKYAGDVKLTKNKELTSKSGITVKYTEAAVSLGSEDIYNILSDVISAAKTDDDLKAVWTSLGYTSEDYDEMISKSEESLGAKEDFSGGSADIILYIGADGKIRGEKITVNSGSENDKSDSETSAVLYTKGREFSFEALGTSSSFYTSADKSADLSYSRRSESEYDLTLSGTYRDGKYTGDGTFEMTEKGAYSYSDEPASDDYDYTDTFSLDIGFSDVDVNSYGNDRPEGTITLSGGSGDGASADMTLTASGKSAECTVNFYEDDEKLFGVAVSSERSEYSAPEVPADNTFRITDDDDEYLRNYINTVDMAKFRENVEKARGSLGDSIADALIEAADEIDSERAALTAVR